MGTFPKVPSPSSMVLAIYTKGGYCPLGNFFKESNIEMEAVLFLHEVFKEVLRPIMGQP